MCEILFKGKRKDTGEWIFGSYLHRRNPCIECFHFAGDGVLEPDIYELIPKTLSEYAGLKDKNGVRIFENDILTHKRNGKTIYGVVEFYRSAFSVKWFDEIYGRDFIGYLAGIEVVGNIFDNPELLNKMEET